MDMFNTGNAFTDYLLLGITFLPLLPTLLIFARKLYEREPFNFLVVICLLSFLRGFIGLAYPVTWGNQYLINKIFTLLLFLFFVLAFQTNLSRRWRNGFNLLLTSLLSILLTWWTLKGWDGVSPAADVLLDGFLAVMIGISLPAIIRSDELGVFRSPLFWMEGGTMFYILLFLLLEGVGALSGAASGPSGYEKRLLLGLADLVRYLAYIAAIYAA